MKIDRTWAMPTPDTFQCLPIGAFVKRYLMESQISIDPFARNCNWASITNDLNPKTSAMYHMDVKDFLLMVQVQGIKPDLVIFDPPYSPHQIKQCYQNIGVTMGSNDGQRPGRWSFEKDIINDITTTGGVVLTFGWNTYGMGKSRGFEIEEILLVCHGAGHNDTICMAERKAYVQHALFT